MDPVFLDTGLGDNQTEYLSDHFQNQLKHGGSAPASPLSSSPRHGVAERFIPTLKGQVIYGRVFQNLQVREAVRAFVDTYNREWLVEKNGLTSPWQARAQWLAQDSIARAA